MENELGLIIKDQKVVVSSRSVAENYRKRHADVIRRVENFISDVPESNERNFALVKYTDKKGEKRPEYLMDRQGFTCIVVGFTGKKAREFTYQYTKAFEEMLKKVREQREISPAELILRQAEMLVKQEQINKELMDRQQLVEDKLNSVAVKRPGDVSAYFIAKKFDLYSANSGRPHEAAVKAIAKHLGIIGTTNLPAGYQDEYVTVYDGHEHGEVRPIMNFSKKALNEMGSYIENEGLPFKPPQYWKRGEKTGQFNKIALDINPTGKRVWLNEETYKAYFNRS